MSIKDKKLESYCWIDSRGRFARPVQGMVRRWMEANQNQSVVLKLQVQRSKKQNAYYWAVIVSSVRNAFLDGGNQYSLDEVHLFLKAVVGGLEKVLEGPDGEAIKYVESSSALSKDEFAEYLEKCIVWCLQNNIAIDEKDLSKA